MLADIYYLLILALPIACISWTVTHEEVFREPREYFTKHSLSEKTVSARKFYYMLTCEYCFSHYVTILVLVLTGYRLLYDDWKGYLVSGFSLVWIANLYMNAYALLRQNIKKEKTEIKVLEKETEDAV